MACQLIRDKNGCLWRVPAFDPKDITRFNPTQGVDVWWDRDNANKADELLMIRQENNDDRADVITLSQGQLYDLLHALASAIMEH